MLVNVGSLMSPNNGRAGSSPLTLLPVGPFAGLTPPPVSGLPTLTPSSDYAVIGTVASPLKVNIFRPSSSILVTPNLGFDSSILIWADTIDMATHSATVNANGQNGEDGSDDSCCCNPLEYMGGNGGTGGSGGGGGSASGSTRCDGGPGGQGGGGNPGEDDARGGGIGSGGQGGSGFGSLVGSSFIFGNGGNSVKSGNTATGGNGYGAGGWGGDVQPSTPPAQAGAGCGGGGAGAGLISIVARIFSPSLMVAEGGNPGNPAIIGGNVQVITGTGGGGGVIWIACQAKLTAGTWFVSGGPFGGTLGIIKLFEIKKDLSLVQHATLTDTWDNT